MQIDKIDVSKAYVTSELTKHQDWSDVITAISQLKVKNVEKLAHSLSKLRGNGIGEILDAGYEWTQETIHLSGLWVTQIKPRVNEMLQECDSRLDRIARHAGLQIGS